jgi:hypothetical protein
VALMQQQGAAINKLDRTQLKQLCKGVDGESWLYFACKRVQHGSSYMMGKNTMSDQILTDSFKLTGKPVVVPPALCETLQRSAFFVRYPGIQRWHTWMAQELKRTGSLTASNGFRRLFYGRKDDKSTLKAALAHLPQVYTTYATKLALWRLWSDPENRREDGSLRAEPLHTVHDSLLEQHRAEENDWAKAKLRQWFDNVVVIAGQPIVIPFEGAAGRDWKHLGDPI